VVETTGRPFRRGDSNAGGTIDISDAVATLQFLFSGVAAVPCLKAADTNDDGSLDLAGAVFL
jgi:hypothetical protein